MIVLHARRAALRVCKPLCTARPVHRKLHALERGLLPSNSIANTSKDWDFHLLDTEDVREVCDLVLTGIASNMNEYTVGDGESIFNGPYLRISLNFRSRFRLLRPSMIVSTDSVVLAATVKGTSEIAAVVEVMLGPEGEMPPILSNPFRSKEANTFHQPYLFNLCVKEEHKKKGLGRMMCEVVQELVHIHWKKNVMHLHVIEGNLAAQNLYIGMGYKLIPHEAQEGPVDIEAGPQPQHYFIRLNKSKIEGTEVDPPPAPR